MTKAPAGKHIGKLTFTLQPDALREIISEGRLSEFASVAAAEAAAQISAQIVDHVAAMSLQPDKARTTSEVSVEYLFDEGGFGFKPPGRGPVSVFQTFMQRKA